MAAPNPLRADPTRTATLRRKFETDLRRRFEKLKAEIWHLIVVEDVFGLKADKLPDPFLPTSNRRWSFRTTSDQVRAFQDWLRQRRNTWLKGTYGTGWKRHVEPDEDLWAQFIKEGFQKGAGRAFDDTKGTERAIATITGGKKLDFYKGTREEFLRSSFAQPETVDKLKLLTGRVFTELDGVSESMATSISRTLADGLVRGMNPRDIARSLLVPIDSYANRAETIARTEIIRAHAEGQLSAMEDLGVQEVGVAVEWSTAGDARVCPLCRPLEGVVMKIEEARGMLPRHPNCRCAWKPANVGEDADGQKRSKKRIQSAIDESVDQEGGNPDNSNNWGPAEPISTYRPESILNRKVAVSAWERSFQEWIHLHSLQETFGG